jgi:hypothetical protein
MLRRQIAFVAVTAALIACTEEKTSPTSFEIRTPLFAVGANSDVNLGTHLNGDEEFLVVPDGAPHPRDSKAQGQAIFRVEQDGPNTRVDFRLIATNINNAFMAHIHCGLPGSNGPIAMWLFPVPASGVLGGSGTALPPGGGRHSGVLSAHSFNADGALCPAVVVNGVTIRPAVPLLPELLAGRTYVNVHTNDGVTPTNTGPGDFPGGELRGQIDHDNHLKIIRP